MKFNKSKLQAGGYLPGASAPVSAPTLIQPRQLYSINPFEPVFQKPDLSQYTGLSATIASKVEAKGLPSDVNNYLSNLSSLQAVESQLTDLDILSNSSRFQQYREIANSMTDPRKTNELRVNEDAFNTAQETVKGKKSQSAFTTNGSTVLVFSEEGLNYISVEQYASAPQNYRVLTNQEALELRRDRLPYENSILTATQRTEGIDAIQKHLEDRMSGLGSAESKSKREGLVAVAQAVSSGQIKGYDGWESFSKNNKKAIESLDVTWHYLTEDQKTQLKLMAVRQFGVSEPEKIEEMAKLAMSAVFSKGYDQASSNWLRSDDDYMLTGARKGTQQTAEIGWAERSILGMDRKGAIQLTSGDTSLTTNGIGSFFSPLAPGSEYSSSGVIGEDKVSVTGVVPFTKTLWNDVGDEITTLDGQPIDRNLLLAESSSQGVLGYEITVGGVTLDTFSKDPRITQFNEKINELDRQAESQIKDPAQLKRQKSLNRQQAADSVFGQGAVTKYEPVLYYEVVAAELEGKPGEAIREQSAKNRTKKVEGYDISKFEAAISEANPGLRNQYDTGWLDRSGEIENFHKMVVKAKPKTGVVNIARTYDGNKITTQNTQVQDIGFRQQLTTSYQGNNPTGQSLITGRFGQKQNEKTNE
jgi:hypothetical protein